MKAVPIRGRHYIVPRWQTVSGSQFAYSPGTVAALPDALGLAGKAGRADADLARQATGYAIGGVAPVGHPAPLPTVLDASLGRFAAVHAAAGHPHCVFATSLDELARLTGGTVSDRIGI